MNTKIVMITSALVMALTAIMLIFIPRELLSAAGYSDSYIAVLFLQVLGALYFAFAVLNWMAKANIIGGIYSKPVAMANYAHFFIAAITLLKTAFQQDVLILWIIAIIYAVFAILFAIIAFGNPLKDKTSNEL